MKASNGAPDVIDTMFMYSKEQVARMHAALEFERRQLGIPSPGM